MWDKVESGLISVDFSKMTSPYCLAYKILILRIRVNSSQRMGDNGYVLSLYVLMWSITFCLPMTVALRSAQTCAYCVTVMDITGSESTRHPYLHKRTKHKRVLLSM